MNKAGKEAEFTFAQQQKDNLEQAEGRESERKE
jgi:hypothetical protein